MSADVCADCGANLQGEPIPQDFIDRGYYGEGVTHYSRVMGHEIRGVYDGVLFWSCPDCGFAWPRDFGVDRRNELSAQYAAEFMATDGAA